VNDALDDVLWELEDPDEVLARESIRALPPHRLAVAVQEAQCVRLRRAVVERANALSPSEARRFAAECVAELLPQWSARYAHDDRPARAVDIALRWSRGDRIDEAERLAAERAAREAGDAAYADCFPENAPRRCALGVSFPAIAYAAAYACERTLRVATVASYASLADAVRRVARLEWQLAWLEAANLQRPPR
jgi:hypothetical protein